MDGIALRAECESDRAHAGNFQPGLVPGLCYRSVFLNNFEGIPENSYFCIHLHSVGPCAACCISGLTKNGAEFDSMQQGGFFQSGSNSLSL